MKLILIVLACLAGLIILIMLIGWRLPRTHEVSRSAVVAAPPAEVYAVLTDFEHAPAWRKELKRIEILQRDPDRIVFRENGAVTYEAASFEPPHRFTATILNRDLGYSGSWSYALAPWSGGLQAAGGLKPAAPLTRVTITERGDVSNVLFRFLSRYVFGHTRTIDTVLEQLKARWSRRSTAPTP